MCPFVARKRGRRASLVPHYARNECTTTSPSPHRKLIAKYTMGTHVYDIARLRGSLETEEGTRQTISRFSTLTVCLLAGRFFAWRADILV